MPPRAATVSAPISAAEVLEGVLRALVAEHDALLKIAGRHRAAIAAADPRAMAACLAEQGAAAERITLLERRRQAAVAELTRAPGSARLTISQVTRTLADPMRTRLLTVADRLRDVLNLLHTEHAAIRAAAELLSSHMEGLMRQVCRRLSHAGTYARTGGIDATTTVTTALDLRT
jgi:hypothetical protein